MPKAVFATMIKCDSTIREIIKRLDNTHHFIIEELDSVNMLIEPGKAELVRQEVDRQLEQNVYSQTDR